MKNIKAKAFTLIELLIVVAIIAILAAIAVPNFLEAQVRSKISRVAADLRTVDLGISMYRLDNNALPYSENVQGAVWLTPGGRPQISNDDHLVGGITSPIAYVSSVPIDAFEHSFPNGSGGFIFGKGPLYYDKAGFGYIDGVFFASRPTLVPSDAVGTRSIEGTSFVSVSVFDPGDMPRDYVLYSLGPDLGFTVNAADGTVLTGSKYHLDNRYDSTNGTVSGGNINRFAGGETFP